MIIGIAGGSGSGKTTLAARLAKALGAGVIAQDSYYFDQSARFDYDGGAVNFDHPDSIDFTLLAQHLAALAHGEQISLPHYDFSTHQRINDARTFLPTPYIVVEGILILTNPDVRAQLDFTVFIEAPETVRFARRLKRDVERRGRTEKDVRRQFAAQVKPMHDQFIEPTRQYADLLVSGEEPIALTVERVLAEIAAL